MDCQVLAASAWGGGEVNNQAPQRETVDGYINDHFQDPWNGSVAEWCCYTDEDGTPNLRLNEPGNRKPFRVVGREYIIESLNDWGDRTVTDCVEVFGSQTGKTCALMAGAAWSIRNDPCGILWVMPSINLAQSFSETRWQPMLEASNAFTGRLPHGADRHDYKKLQQQLCGSVINFVGSNSPANLASRPARKVVLDEVDKFDGGGSGEADAVNLAEQRTKGQNYPQRRKTSTPSVIGGLIWQEFMKGDQRRFYVPCPLCSKSVVFAWSKRFTVLPSIPELAFVEWDKEAHRPDGSWDMDRVARSARAVCPHCAGHILDSYKTRMLPSGQWKATTPAQLGFKSRHLPSLYAVTPETTFGALAVKFLRAKRSLMGLQGFINGDLAEPFEGQDRSTERVELITSKIDLSAEWKRIMTVDCQAKAPHFWFVVRAWNGGNSHGIEAGAVDTWEEVRAKQLEHGVEDIGVVVDSGYGARDDAEVYRQCARFCSMVPNARSERMLALGWMPAKGFPSRKRWRDEATGLQVPYYLRGIDPFIGTSDAGKVEMSLFEFSGDFFKDVLDSLRRNQSAYKWSVPDSMATEDYWRHMDSNIKMAKANKRTGRVAWEWIKRSAHWPDHLNDCEVMQTAAAMFYGIFNPEEQTE